MTSAGSHTNFFTPYGRKNLVLNASDLPPFVSQMGLGLEMVKIERA